MRELDRVAQGFVKRPEGREPGRADPSLAFVKLMYVLLYYFRVFGVGFRSYDVFR